MTKTDPVSLPRGLTVDDVADAFRVSHKTIYRLIAANRIPSVRVGSRLRIPRSFVEDVLAYERDALA